MSLFRWSDYTNASKKQTTYSKKTKIPTKMRTHKIKCSISGCKEHAPFPVMVSDTQVFNLCKKHAEQHKLRDVKFEVETRRASQI